LWSFEKVLIFFFVQLHLPEASLAISPLYDWIAGSTTYSYYLLLLLTHVKRFEGICVAFDLLTNGQST
jgi:hypothetical protein